MYLSSLINLSVKPPAQLVSTIEHNQNIVRKIEYDKK